MGIPAHLSKRAFVSNDYIWIYSNKGKKDITEMQISDLIIYDKPKELGEFRQCHKCEYLSHCKDGEYSCDGTHRLTRPPQSWCYVEEVV